MTPEPRPDAPALAAQGLRVARPMILALGAMLVVAVVSLQVLSVLRAYVEGEGLYSKGQKDAVFHLAQYAHSRDPFDLQRYRVAIARPLGDQVARTALQQPSPDRALARTGFLEGGNHAEDVNGLIWLFILFHRLPPFAHAIDLWTHADDCNRQIVAVATRLQSPDFDAGDPTSVDLAIAELGRINREIAPIEDAFSMTIAEVARRTTEGLSLALGAFTLLLVALCVRAARAQLRERKRYEKALRTSEGRYRAIFESNIDAILVVEPDGTILRANRAAATLFGFGPGALRSQNIRDLNAEGAAPGLSAQIVRQEAGLVEHVLRRQDRATFAAEASVARFTDGDGHERFSLTIRDLTDRKRFDAERLAVAEQLQHSRKMEAIGQLAGGIAHDFNNILTTVLGYAAMLERALSPGSKAHDWAGRIAASGARATELVKQILTFARRGGVEREPHDLVPICADAMSLLRGSLPATTELKVSIEPEALVCNVNPAQISQVLVNLCVNARDSLNQQPGRIRVDVSRRPAGGDAATFADAERAAGDDRIVFGRLNPERAHARIEVSDTGTGMSSAVLRHIFTPFYTTKERGRGTGLGLAVVHGIVSDSGGACLVESRPAAGTTVSIWLPIVDAMPAAQPVTAPGALEGHERILIVDDEPFIGDLLATSLAALGYATRALTDPLAAAALIEHDPQAFDLVVSDQVMPKLTGIALLERIHGARRSLPVILMTGYSTDVTEESALKAGASGFFHKPVSAEQLARRIRRLFTGTDLLARAERTA